MTPTTPEMQWYLSQMKLLMFSNHYGDLTVGYDILPIG